MLGPMISLEDMPIRQKLWFVPFCVIYLALGAIYSIIVFVVLLSRELIKLVRR